MNGLRDCRLKTGFVGGSGNRDQRAWPADRRPWASPCGLPNVTTDTPGYREIVTDNESGLLVPPRNAEALANALERLITDPELRHRMGERGRAWVLERFAEKHVVQATLDVYREFDSSAVTSSA